MVKFMVLSGVLLGWCVSAAFIYIVPYGSTAVFGSRLALYVKKFRGSILFLFQGLGFRV